MIDDNPRPRKVGGRDVAFRPDCQVLVVVKANARIKANGRSGALYNGAPVPRFQKLPSLALVGGDGQLSMTTAARVGRTRKRAPRIIAGKRYIKSTVSRIGLATGQCAHGVDD